MTFAKKAWAAGVKDCEDAPKDKKRLRASTNTHPLQDFFVVWICSCATVGFLE